MNGELHRLAGAYALGALSEEEAAFFERHLVVCEPCRIEVEEYLETAAVLGMASSEAPPERMRQAVLDEVSRTRQLRPVPSVPLWTRMRANLAPVAAALVAVVLALGGTTLYLMDRLDDERGATSITADVQTVLVAADARTVALEPANGAEGRVSLVYSPSVDMAILVGRDLPQMAEGEELQLWLFHDGEPVPAVAAGVDASGDLEVVQRGSVDGAEMAAVTIEPAGGSPAPTGPVLVSAGLD